MRKISEYQKEKKRKKDRETLQRKRDAINGPTKTARLKAEKEERAEMKAEKELQQMKSERRQQPSVMWERLLDGEMFEDVKLKPTNSSIERINND
jgi:hypothetical protein